MLLLSCFSTISRQETSQADAITNAVTIRDTTHSPQRHVLQHSLQFLPATKDVSSVPPSPSWPDTMVTILTQSLLYQLIGK